jgi:hypothetical protein
MVNENCKHGSFHQKLDFVYFIFCYYLLSIGCTYQKTKVNKGPYYWISTGTSFSTLNLMWLALQIHGTYFHQTFILNTHNDGIASAAEWKQRKLNKKNK